MSLNSLAPEFNNKYDRMPDVPMGKMSRHEYHQFCKRKAELENCAARVADCNKCEVECVKDECCDSTFSLGWLGALILWFIIFTVLFWLIFYSLRPGWAL